MQNVFSGFLYYQLFQLLFKLAKPVVIETKTTSGKFVHTLPDDIDSIDGDVFCIKDNYDILWLRHHSDRKFWAKFIVQERTKDAVFKINDKDAAVIDCKILLDYLLRWDHPQNQYNQVISANHLEQIVIQMCNETIGGLLHKADLKRDLVFYHNLATVGCQTHVYHHNVLSGLMDRGYVLKAIVDSISTLQPMAMLSVYFHEVFVTLKNIGQWSGCGVVMGVDEVFTAIRCGDDIILFAMIGIGREQEPTFLCNFTLAVEIVDPEMHSDYDNLTINNVELSDYSDLVQARKLIGKDARRLFEQVERLNQPKPQPVEAPEDLTDQLPL